jgi:hypothetical protein
MWSRPAALGSSVGLALFMGLVLPASPALASPTSVPTVAATTPRGVSVEPSPGSDASSSPSPSPSPSVPLAGSSSTSLPDSCSSQVSLPPECSPHLALALLQELRDLRTFLTVALSLMVALLAAVLMLQVGRR